MVAYSFQPRFELPIVNCVKRGTVRAVGRRRHAMAGDELQLYVGMRTKKCRLIATAVCIANEPISISFEHFVIQMGTREAGTFQRLVGIDDVTIAALLDPFAREDGFADFAEMAAFWRETHGPADFQGRHIRWATKSVQVRA